MLMTIEKNYQLAKEHFSSDILDDNLIPILNALESQKPLTGGFTIKIWRWKRRSGRQDKSGGQDRTDCKNREERTNGEERRNRAERNNRYEGKDRKKQDLKGKKPVTKVRLTIKKKRYSQSTSGRSLVNKKGGYKDPPKKR